MKAFIKSNKFVYLLLAIIMVAGICRYSYGFFVQKKGTHSDEEWSFGLANSYYEPHIFGSDNSTDSFASADDMYIKNINEWLDGDVLKDYLTVQEGERFAFGSVYYNMSCDMHPPLYFYVLHFLSSFFVDQYVPALGLVINLICYIVLSIFLYKLLMLITKSRAAGVLGVCFNTFTVGALSMVVFIRMYMMLAMFALILAYLVAKLYYRPDVRTKWTIYVQMGIITCLGALTHHFFLPYAFIITVILCICFLVKRQWRTLFAFGGCMALGVALSIALFPATLDHMFGITMFEYRDAGMYEEADSLSAIAEKAASAALSDADGSALTITTDDIENYEWKIFKYYFATCFQFMFQDVLGWSPVSPYNQGILLYVPVVLLVLIALLAAWAFLFRKEDWFLRLRSKCIASCKRLPKTCKRGLSRFNWALFALFAAIFFVVMITSIRVDVIGMGECATRYLFIVYPLFQCFLFLILYTCIRVVVHNKKILRVCILGLCSVAILIVNNLYQSCVYLFSAVANTNQVLEAISTDSNVIVISSSQWLLTTYTPVLSDCDSFYYAVQNDLDALYTMLSQDELPEQDVYLIIDTSYMIADESAASSIADSVASGFTDLTGAHLYNEYKNKDNPNCRKDLILEKICSLADVDSCDLVYPAAYFGNGQSIEVYKLR